MRHRCASWPGHPGHRLRRVERSETHRRCEKFRGARDHALSPPALARSFGPFPQPLDLVLAFLAHGVESNPAHHAVDHRLDAVARLFRHQRRIARKAFARLAKALSLTYGLEVLIILKDLWGLEADEMQEVVVWAGRALVKTAIAEAAG